MEKYTKVIIDGSKLWYSFLNGVYSSEVIMRYVGDRDDSMAIINLIYDELIMQCIDVLDDTLYIYATSLEALSYSEDKWKLLPVLPVYGTNQEIHRAMSNLTRELGIYLWMELRDIGALSSDACPVLEASDNSKLIFGVYHAF